LPCEVPLVAFVFGEQYNSKYKNIVTAIKSWYVTVLSREGAVVPPQTGFWRGSECGNRISGANYDI